LSYELGVERPFPGLWQLLNQRPIGLTKLVHSEQALCLSKDIPANADTGQNWLIG